VQLRAQSDNIFLIIYHFK